MAATISEEGYPPSWDHADNSDIHHSGNPQNTYGRLPPAQPGQQPLTSRESLESNANVQVPPTPTKSSHSPPRSSAESPRPSGSRWRDSALPATFELPDAAAIDTNTLVEPNFDEAVLRQLIELDVRHIEYIYACFVRKI